MDVLSSLLTTLVDGALDEESELMLNEVYKISTANFSQMTENNWAELQERAEQAKWFIDQLEEIKAKFQLLIDGQIAFREFQGWLAENGYKGAEKIEKAKINVAVARAKYGKTVTQRKSKLQKLTEHFEGETTQFKILWDNKVIVAIAKEVNSVNAQIEKMQDDPEFAAKLAEWKEEKDNKLKRATFALKYGSHGLSHLSLAPANYSSQSSSFSNQPAQFAQFNQSRMPMPNRLPESRTGGMAGRSSAKDSIKVAFDWSEDMAGKAKGFASQINRGFSRVGNFLTGNS